MTETASQPVATPNFAPAYFASFACSAAMLAFVSFAGPLAEATGLAAWQLGITVTVAGLAWVVAATYWGRVSDRIGRKPVILTGLAIFAVSYAAISLVITAGFYGWAGAYVVLAGLIVTRAAIGFGYAAVPAGSNALIADYIAPDDRATFMGRFGAGQAMGMIFGPGLVALAMFLSMEIALIILTGLVVVAAIYAAKALPDSHKKTGAAKKMSLFDARVRATNLFGFFSVFATGIAQITVGFVAIQRFGLDTKAATQLAALALFAVGVALIPAQLVIGRLGWKPDQLVRRGALIAATGALWAAFAPEQWQLIASYGVAGFGAGWMFAGLTARASVAVSHEEQGQAAGAISAAQGLGGMTGPMIGAALFDLWPVAPMVLASAAFGLVGLGALLVPVVRHRES